MHLPEFGWEPFILTVQEKYYEEDLDFNLLELLPFGLKVEKVKAFRVTKPRIIGDIGLRSFFQLYRGAKRIIERERIDFILITIPSFYIALLGKKLYRKTGVPFGIDYIDPWVHEFPGSEKKLSRHWWSTKLAGKLEPMALKKVSLISGVAEEYYKGVLERNPNLKKSCVFGAMPYGAEPNDHIALATIKRTVTLFEKNPKKFQFVYAGAMLPKAYDPLERIFESIMKHFDFFSKIEFHFIGTGKHPNNPSGYNIRPLAEKYNIWGTVIFEYPKRVPYLDVLLHLCDADGIFILGSTEPHYTPSTVFQGVLSGKPVMAILNEKSTACQVIKTSHTGMVLEFDGSKTMKIRDSFENFCKEFLEFSLQYDVSKTDREAFGNFTAKNSTRKLASLMDQAIKLSKKD